MLRAASGVAEAAEALVAGGVWRGGVGARGGWGEVRDVLHFLAGADDGGVAEGAGVAASVGAAEEE